MLKSKLMGLTIRSGLVALVLFVATSLAAAAGQEQARVAHSLGDGDIIVPSDTETDVVLMIQRALQILGYDPGPADGEIGTRTRRAFAQYRKAKGFSETDAGLLLTLESLALDLAMKRPVDSQASQVAAELSSTLHDDASDTSARESATACIDGLWVASVRSDGQIVALEDGSVFEIRETDRVDTRLWLPNEEVLICGRKLANMDAGDAMLATRIR